MICWGSSLDFFFSCNVKVSNVWEIEINDNIVNAYTVLGDNAVTVQLT